MFFVSFPSGILAAPPHLLVHQYVAIVAKCHEVMGIIHEGFLSGIGKGGFHGGYMMDFRRGRNPSRFHASLAERVIGQNTFPQVSPSRGSNEPNVILIFSHFFSSLFLGHVRLPEPVPMIPSPRTFLQYSGHRRHRILPCAWMRREVSWRRTR